MVWLILIVIVVGYFIVKAINRNTVNNAVIAQQQYLNSPEYKNQTQADMAYWGYVNDTLDYQIWITEAEIKAYNLPDSFTGVTYDNGKESKPKKYTKKEIIEGNKAEIKNLKKNLKELKEEYEAKKSEYAGYYPSDINTIRDKYDFTVPFPVSDDGSYLNEDNASSWSMYEERLNKLKRRQWELSNLQKGVDVQKLTLEQAAKIFHANKTLSIAMLERELHIDYWEAKKLIEVMKEKGIIPDILKNVDLWKAAVNLVIETQSASTSLLQRRLRIGYDEAAKLIQKMEDEGIVSSANGTDPRKVLKLA
jgi:hypothetical protein